MQVVQVSKTFYGGKTRTSLNGESGLVTAMVAEKIEQAGT